MVEIVNIKGLRAKTLADAVFIEICKTGEKKRLVRFLHLNKLVSEMF